MPDLEKVQLNLERYHTDFRAISNLVERIDKEFGTLWLLWSDDPEGAYDAAWRADKLLRQLRNIVK